MPLDFPSSPVVNQTYTLGTRTWKFNGEGWELQGANSGYSGYSGISGYSGVSGISGYSGWSGISGYSGFSGISGYSGLSGYSGFSGISGYSGTSGYSGSSGYSGYSGQSGPSTTINATEDTTSTTLYPVMVAATGSDQTAKATSTTNKLQFDASTGTLSTTNFNSLSDVSIKKDIETINSALEKVLSMRGVIYKFKETNQKSIGVIAQEIEQVVPEVVSTTDYGIKTVSYGNIVGILIEAIKEQQRQIDELKRK